MNVGTAIVSLFRRTERASQLIVHERTRDFVSRMAGKAEWEEA
jgi:hypothetical protein